MLQGTLEKLVQADEVLFGLNARVEALRKRRDQKIQDLILLLASLRQSVTSHYVAPNLSQIGFEDRTARNLTPLFRQVDRIASSFEHEGLGDLLGATYFKQSSFNPSDHVAELKEEALTARVLSEQLGESRRELEAAVLAKQGLLEEYDRLEVRTARPFEDFCRLAGEKKLADRVRPKVRRSTPTPAPPEEPEDVDEPGVDETSAPQETSRDASAST